MPEMTLENALTPHCASIRRGITPRPKRYIGECSNAEPRNPDAMHLLGVLAYQIGTARRPRLS